MSSPSAEPVSAQATDSPAADPFRRFRKVAWVEGISLLLLFGIAMPLKYFADMPLAVRIVGSIHGGLFLWYCAEVVDLMMRKVWRFKSAALAMVASSVPFATFWLDRRLQPDPPA